MQKTSGNRCSPETIEQKSSSSRTIAAASLETSEAETFMEMPRSAFLSAGASLTPSPETPTI